MLNAFVCQAIGSDLFSTV